MHSIKHTTLSDKNHLSTPAGSPLTPMERTLLERLITRIRARSPLPTAEIWASLKHDLQIDKDAPLLSQHFQAAADNLTQRLQAAEDSLATRHTVQQLTALLPLGNNRQAVKDYIRQTFGLTALSQLSQAQLTTVLDLLQNNQLTIPAPQLRQSSDRQLLAAEHHSLNQAVIKLAATTGESGPHIWQTMMELAGVASGEPIPARLFSPLSTWLAARQSLSQSPALTLENLYTTLKQPLSENEWQGVTLYAEQQFQISAKSMLSPLQAQTLVNYIFLMRVNRSPDLISTRNIITAPAHRRPALSSTAKFTLSTLLLLLILAIIALGLI